MKIEKVNENQIRCTLTKEDLADRQIKLSELAYGTEKAKSLFRDMMQQASVEFGFEAEDIPLMIEAIPLSSDCIILVITKVEYPEELDTRFSKFSPTEDDEFEDDEEEFSDFPPQPDESANGILDLFKQEPANDSSEFIPLQDAIRKKKDSVKEEVPVSVLPTDLKQLYMFSSLDDVAQLADVFHGFYNGENTLYKNPKNNRYYLVLSKSGHTPEEFNKICNIASEFAISQKLTDAMAAFFAEHFITIISLNALQALSLA